MDHRILLEALKHTQLGPDVFALYGLVRYSHAMRIVEIGVRSGGSTRALLLGGEENGSQEIISIDIRPCNRFPDNPIWKFVRGDSRRPELPAEIGVDQIDLLFIDSSHRVQDTEKELEIWTPLVVDGGFAAFHDTKTYAEGVRVPLLQYIKKQRAEGIHWSLTELEHSPHGFTYAQKTVNKGS